MNQIILLLQPFFFVTTFFSIPFYNNQITTLKGDNIDVSIYSGQTVLIIPFNQSPDCAVELQQLDSLQRTDDSIKIIATPAIDFGSYKDNDSLQSFIDSLGLNLIITQPMQVKKGDGQDALYQWLTNVHNNSHFDDDVAEAGRMFIIDGKGVLYANVQKDILMSNLAPIIYSNKTPNY